MRLLQKPAWSKFGSDGKLFEDLSILLLKREYPSIKFSQTQRSWDGGKDAFANSTYVEDDTRRVHLHAHANSCDNPEKWWAESKSKGLTSGKGNTTLVLDDVSKTMYMAYLEQVNRVVVFSFSPFNREFWRHLNPRDAHQSFLVVGYSGEQLDRLILKHLPPGSTDFEHFFGSYEPLEETSANAGDVNVFYRPRHEKAAEDSCGEKLYCVGDVLGADIFAVNRTDFEQRIHIRLPMSRNAKLQPLNGFDESGKTTWTVAPHSGQSLVVRFKIEDFAERISFPRLAIQFEHGGNVRRAIGRSVACTWLAETELIGSCYHSAFDRFDRLAENGRPACLTIIGGSGTGKSRLLKELECANRCRFDLVCSLDTDVEESSFGLATRLLVSQLERLPLLEANALTQLVNKQELSEKRLFVWKVLYDADFEAAEHIGELADYLSDALVRSRTLLVLDNVQNYDTAFVGFLDAVVDRIQCLESRSAIILSFNSDTVGFNKKAVDLEMRLESLSGSRRDQFGLCPLEGFSEEDALVYLNRCLSGETHDSRELLYAYDESLRFIVETWGCNPYCLKQLLICMFYDGTLKRGQSARFYVSDVSGFHRALNRMPKELRGLLDRRFDQIVGFIRGQNLDEAGFYRFMALLAFVKHMSPALYRAAIGDVDLLALAEHAGFVTRDGRGFLRFTHRHLLRFVQDRLSYEDRIPHDAFVRACDQKGLVDEYFTHYFVSRSILSEGALPDELIDSAILHLRLSRVAPELSMQFLRPLIGCIRAEPGSYANATYLQVLAKAVSMATNTVGIEGQCEIAELLVADVLTGARIFTIAELETVFNVACEYLRGSVTLGRQGVSLDAASGLAGILDDRYGHSREEDICRIRIIGCQAIAYYKLNDMENGLERADEYASMAERLDDDYFRARGSLLRGDVYYHADLAGSHRDAICRHWTLAYERFVAAFGEELESGFGNAAKINIYMKSLMTDLIRHDFREADRKAKFVENCIGNTRMTYFEIKTRLVVAAYLLAIGSRRKDRILRVIDEAADKSLRYGNVSSYAASFCLRGLAYLSFGDDRRASGCLHESLGLIDHDIVENRRGGGWDYFLAGLLAAEQAGELDFGNTYIGLRCSQGKDLMELLATGEAADEAVAKMLDRFILWRFPNSQCSFPKL